MRKQQVVVIHGGDSYESYEEYLADLQAKDVTLERILQKDWKDDLQDKLGNDFQVLCPQMPNKQNAVYEEWKIMFEKILELLDDAPILIGHSLGGIFLAHYFSETNVHTTPKAVILVAAPHDQVGSFEAGSMSHLQTLGSSVHLFHSTDDFVVPFTEFEKYQSNLPDATAHTFDDKIHFFNKDFPELVALLTKL